MASPTIHSYSAGSYPVSGYQFDITLPPVISSTDTLLLFISSAPSSWAYPHDMGGYWRFKYSYYPEDYFSPCLTVLINEDPNGDGTDFLSIITYFPFWHNGTIDSVNASETWLYEHRRTTKISYICYAISGMKKGTFDVWGHNRYLNTRFTSGSFTSYWDLLQCPANDDALIGDYLWLAPVASSSNIIPTAAPSGFSNLITAQSSGTSSQYDCSMSSSSRSTTGISKLDPGPYTVLNAYWAGVLIRIPPPETTPEDEQPLETGGIGLYIRNKEFHTYTGIETVDIYPDTMNFNYDGSEDGNPLQAYIELVSTNNWTASWISNTHFDASMYSGGEGTHHIEITCRDLNSSVSTYVDTLTITSGLSSDTVTVYQKHP